MVALPSRSNSEDTPTTKAGAGEAKAPAKAAPEKPKAPEKTTAVPAKAPATVKTEKPKAPIKTTTQAKEVHFKSKDPVVLQKQGEQWLKKGNKDQAQRYFDESIKKREINYYFKLAGKPYGKALSLELMGDYTASRALWRSQFKHNVQGAIFAIARFSIDPQKDTLLNDAKTHINGLVAAVKAGETPHVYTTKKGKPRLLKAVTQEEAMAAFLEGKRLRYVYIDELDLTNKTLTKDVRCARCIIGSIKTWGATFEQKLNLANTIVVGTTHLGKKWKGAVNKSVPLAPAKFNILQLRGSIFLGDINMDSIAVTGRVLNAPLCTFMGNADLRNMRVSGTAEFRYSTFFGAMNLKGSRFFGSNYFGYTQMANANLSQLEVHNQVLYFNSAIFNGSMVAEESQLIHGATFENTVFNKGARFEHWRVDGAFNISRVQSHGDFDFTRMQMDGMTALGAQFHGKTRFNDSEFAGHVRFTLDDLTRREHLKDAAPLHKLYKRYQGDDDAEEILTTGGQYGVEHVNDLTAQFGSSVSFANTTFSKLVGFERVHFKAANPDDVASFYNTQFHGEAHFERTRFESAADFRTITANELSFNGAQFNQSWMLDDANVRGRLTLDDAKLVDNANVSIFGSSIASFGIGFSQLMKNPRKKWKKEQFRLFYLECLRAKKDNAKYSNDSRLADVRWDPVKEQEITDETEITKRTERLCMDRTISEFVTLRDAFSSRSMAAESDWAYWHLKHYERYRDVKTSTTAMSVLYRLEWLIFEKAFGWGVLLQNLFLTCIATVLFFWLLQRLFCGDMIIVWDDKEMCYKELPIYAMVLLSASAFLVDSGLSASVVPQATKWWKIIYTIEVGVGIIIITFFIGAYTRLVVSGG